MSWPPPNYRPDQGSGYKVSFDDFQQLISDPYCQARTAPLLRAWYNYEIVGHRPNTVVRSAEGEDVDVAQLHERIQADPQKQYTLYQTSMDLWR